MKYNEHLIAFFGKDAGFKYTSKILLSDLKGIFLGLIISTVGCHALENYDLFISSLIVYIVGISTLFISLVNLLLGIKQHFNKL